MKGLVVPLLLVLVLFVWVASDRGAGASKFGQGVTGVLQEYRDHFCYNRSFVVQDACSWNYLPRLRELTLVNSTTARKNVGSAAAGEQILQNKAISEERVRLMILMQNGRVGSTWLVQLLNQLAKHVKCEGEGFDSNPCKDVAGYINSQRSQWKKSGIATYKLNKMKAFLDECESSSKFLVCGFKMLYSNWDSRISTQIKDFMLETSRNYYANNNTGPKLKIICLHRDNVLEQVASKAYKGVTHVLNLSVSASSKKVSEAARSLKLNFSLPSIESGNADKLFIDQRTFVDYCWSWVPYADVLALEYGTLTRDPDNSMKKVLAFLGAKKKKSVEASNSSKLAHDWSNVINLDEYRAVPRWEEMINSTEFSMRPNGCAHRSETHIVPLEAHFVGDERDCVEARDSTQTGDDYFFEKC